MLNLFLVILYAVILADLAPDRPLVIFIFMACPPVLVRLPPKIVLLLFPLRLRLPTLTVQTALFPMIVLNLILQLTMLNVPPLSVLT